MRYSNIKIFMLTLLKSRKIRDIIRGVPTFSEIEDAMKRAGCAMTASDIDVSDQLVKEGMVYHPYMRARMSLYRLKDMIR